MKDGWHVCECFSDDINAIQKGLNEVIKDFCDSEEELEFGDVLCCIMSLLQSHGVGTIRSGKFLECEMFARLIFIYVRLGTFKVEGIRQICDYPRKITFHEIKKSC